MNCPSLNVLGTFFPAWMLCALIGIGAAIAAHLLVARTQLRGDVKPEVLAYPSVALSVAFILWLILYGQ